MIVEILLGVSILINVFLVWYLARLLKKFLSISEELETLFLSLEDYSEHVNIVYGMERFYGDTTLENLMRHSKTVADQAENFRIIYDMNYELQDDENYEDYGEQ